MVSLSLDPPPSAREGQAPRRGARRFALTTLVVVVAAIGFVAGRWSAPGGRFPITWSGGPGPAALPAPAAPSPGSAQAAAAPAAPAAQQPAAPPTPVPARAVAGSPAAEPAAAPPAPAAAAAATPPAPAGPRRLRVTLAGPLEESITAAVPAEDKALAGELTQVVNRLLVWNLQVARDGRKGDRLDVLYSPPGTLPAGVPGSGEPLVEALRYDSQKLSGTLAAYRFQAPGARFARYYRADGSELEERLVDSPTPEYDQITSLLRDGRRHKGVDFRAPVGSPVYATFDGVVERRNWNFAGNGNCLDMRDLATGRHAIFLHLEVLPKDMVPGRKVAKGERIASSGNSGHSFAPHLHYQLESPDGRVLDPFEVQAVRRATLEPAVRAAFEAERTRLDAALSGSAVARASAAPAVVPAAATR